MDEDLAHYVTRDIAGRYDRWMRAWMKRAVGKRALWTLCVALALAVGGGNGPTARVARADGAVVTARARAAVDGGRRADLYVNAAGWPDLSAALSLNSKEAKTRLVVELSLIHI